MHLGRTPTSREDASPACLANTTGNELWTQWVQVIKAAQLWIRFSTVGVRWSGPPKRYSGIETSPEMHSYFVLIINDLLPDIFKYFTDIYVKKFMPS